MQALQHATKTGMLDGRVWGRLGKPHQLPLYNSCVMNALACNNGCCLDCCICHAGGQPFSHLQLHLLTFLSACIV